MSFSFSVCSSESALRMLSMPTRYRSVISSSSRLIEALRASIVRLVRGKYPASLKLLISRLSESRYILVAFLYSRSRTSSWLCNVSFCRSLGHCSLHAVHLLVRQGVVSDHVLGESIYCPLNCETLSRFQPADPPTRELGEYCGGLPYSSGPSEGRLCGHSKDSGLSVGCFRA